MAGARPAETSERLSIARGGPLGEEPGLGALTLPGYLREVTGRFASREALVLQTDSGTVRWSYRTLWERSLQVARALVACGVGRDCRVGILMTNRPEWLAAFFGTGLAGGVAVPLSTFSTPRELEFMLQSSGVSLLLFEAGVLKKDFAAMLGELEPAILRARPGELASARFPFLRRLAAVDAPDRRGCIETWPEFLARGEQRSEAHVDAAAASVQPADKGAIFFSSGTTGRPKGILSAQRAVAIQLWRWERICALGEGVRCWTPNGLFWSGNVGMGLGTALSGGGTLVLQPTFRPAEALDLIESEAVNFVLCWPHQWAQLKDAPNWDRVDLGSVRYLAHCPEASHPTLRNSWTDPQAYGNTETFTINAAYPCCTPEAVTHGSHGKPLPGNTVKIVDPLEGDVLPLGQRGEIAVKGPTLMLGYLGVPADESLDADGFLRTGDGGYLDETGRLFWEGRLSDIIKTGGANVSPAEVDEALGEFPGVKIARTVGVPHDTLGEMVVSCVVPRDGVALGEVPIRDFLKQRLASYKVPRRVLFFRAEELPLTGSAKIKSELCELAARRLEAEGLEAEGLEAEAAGSAG